MAKREGVRGRRLSLLAGTACLLVLLAFLVQWVATPPRTRSLASAFASGSISVREFSQFLSDSTGLPVLGSRTDFERRINVFGDVPPFDIEVVNAILETNRLRVLKEQLPSGKEVLKLEPMVTIGPGGETDPEPFEDEVISPHAGRRPQ